jgi:ADP-heptose:LPS heptosyltransferase
MTHCKPIASRSAPASNRVRQGRPGVVPERILLIRLKSMGDILFTLPAVQVIRENYPGAKIAFMASREYASLLEGFGPVDQAITIDRARYHRGKWMDNVTQTLSLLRRLRRERFSLAVDFQGYGETGLLTWCSGARQRWGSVYQPLRAWAYTRGLNRSLGVHPVDWNLSLLEQCGLRLGAVRNEFNLPEAALAEARRLFAARGLEPARPAVFIQPFTSTPKKNWPLQHYLAVARRWQALGIQVLFGGGPADHAALAPARAAGFPVFAGAPLLVAGGLMQLSSLVVGGDTGLLHLAVALGQRVRMLISRADPGASIPYRHPDWIIKPQTGSLIGQIEVDQVLAAAAVAFDERTPAPAFCKRPRQVALAA